MNNLFTDEISVSLLNLGSDLGIVRKLIRKLKRTIDELSVIKSQSDIKEFKRFEEINIMKSINAVQYDDNKFIKLKFEINPYLIFIESNTLEEGLNDIILQPNFLPCNDFHYVPTYLLNKDKNLKSLKSKYSCCFCFEEIHNNTNATKEEIVDILKSFLLKQYIIISENG